jgi:uncharacterized Tic20 family protein
MDQNPYSNPSGGSAPPQAPAPVISPNHAEPTSDDRTMAMLAHLLAIFTWFIGPLIIWLMKRESSPFVDDQGKESLNFQLTVGIAYIALGVLSCLTLGLGTLLFPIVGIVVLVFCIIACMQANKGIRYRYPINLRLIK